MSHTETIQQVYDAFLRGDVPAILERVADDVVWDNSRVASSQCPWNGDFSGKSRLPGFFAAVGEHLDFETGVFDPHTYIESGNHVVVLLRLESTVRKNGQKLKSDAVHVWTIGPDRRIQRYQHFNDTAAELAAWRA